MANTKTIYVANDGKEFDTEHAADAHNTFLEAEGTIEAYIDFAGLAAGGAQAGLIRRHLPAFLSFQERDDLDGRIEAALARVAQEKAAAKATAEKKKADAKAATEAGEA